MSSIRQIQTERTLQNVVNTLYSEGRVPTLSEVIQRVAKILSTYPAGSPLPLPLRDALAGGISDPDAFSQFLGFTAMNLGLLYEASLAQVEELLGLTASFQTHLERLQVHRRRIENQVDNHLLALYNTDGYFLVLGDSFATLDDVDLSFTSAYVDTVSGGVSLPTISSLTTKVRPDQISAPGITVTVGQDNKPHPYTEIAPFNGAILSGMENLVWAFEVETDRPTEVVAVVDIGMGSVNVPVFLSRVEFTPYGSVPVQVYAQTSSGQGLSVFGKKIQMSSTRMVFNDSVRAITGMRFTLRKVEPDYTVTDTGRTKYRYIFGAKNISLYEQAHDKDARFVSSGLYLPETDAGRDYVIDAVSLEVDEVVPAGTSIKYYIAPDVLGAESLEDFAWKRVIPVESSDIGEKVLRFDGSVFTTKRITFEPDVDDLPQILLTTTGEVEGRNPSPSIVSGADIYRLAELDEEDILVNSISLIEGSDTLKIYSKEATTGNFADLGLSFWTNDILNPASTAEISFGRIDAGNGFFYGGDVGASYRDVYAETYVYCDTSFNTFVSEFQKSDSRSRTWPVKVFHNGEQVGYLPVGVNSLQIPWKFQAGTNHIGIMLRIPADTVITSPYAGSLSIMADRHIKDYGSVRLATWSYVDFFTMQYNEVGSPMTFTIHNGEIITRRKPTTNFIIRYAKASGDSIQGLRLRADLSRSTNNVNVTPSFSKYRIRFSFGG